MLFWPKKVKNTKKTPLSGVLVGSAKKVKKRGPEGKKRPPGTPPRGSPGGSRRAEKPVKSRFLNENRGLIVHRPKTKNSIPSLVSVLGLGGSALGWGWN